MLFVKHHPGPPLAEFVECFWFCDNYHVPHAKERLMPDGAMSLVFNLHEDEIRVYDRDDPSRCDRLRGASIVGPHSRYFIIDTSEQRSVIGVQFHPGGAFPFLRLGPAELWNQHVALEDVWGSFANDLRCKLLEAGGAPAMFAVLERELLARAVKPFDPHPAVRYALAEFRAGVTTVSRVTDRIGLSERRFIERFRNEVGLTPKLFCRVRRFQSVLRRVHRGAAIAWPDIALACGYFDQAHFAHDFREFSGINATTYLSLANEHLNHVPMAG